MQQNQPSSPTPRDNNSTIYCLAASIFFSLLFLLSLSSTNYTTTPTSSSPDTRLFPNTPHVLNNPNSPPLPFVPSIAYFITGSIGDASRIFRLLLSVYHPKNFYLLHIDRFAPQADRDRLAIRVNSMPVFRAARNVHVIGKADFAYPKGSSPISSLLRGASILLRLNSNWDWFINLSAKDYPLVTQDDLLHILSYLPKDLNFVNHTSYIGWRESRRMKPIIVDPGLYLAEKTGMFYATQKRDFPNAYQLFSGSPTSVLNRKFVEFCVLGSDNLPRILLMYLANTPSSLLSYIPTIVCNSPEFKESTVNHNLQYASYYTTSNENPRFLNGSDFQDILHSGSAFASQFRLNDPILDRIDKEILGRSRGSVVPGGWCVGDTNNTCAVWGDANILRPGPGAERLERRMVELLTNGAFRTRQCLIE
ncbi:beta-glucuronosyltransferase GlcAT14A [Amaranthus tricolor]|uniref:beta-glucuronosyltransferase GlcAT14A n=1 Tax=Amaranthus tricolor TaxID=29722 RepID=UPI002584CCE3|nr:beta-glucuronosyltransferase GlcAT14A [Amaranthus tricolor]